MPITLKPSARRRIDPDAYGKLLANAQPRIIRTEKDNQAAIAELERLDMLDRPVTPEEGELAELLTALITKFEEEHYSLLKSSPLENLRALMEHRELRQIDLVPIFGASSTASQVQTGKRAISKAQAKKLAEFFRVDVSLFL
jgi:HTH-type transcriptional regulator/antitoxin HigA